MAEQREQCPKCCIRYITIWGTFIADGVDMNRSSTSFVSWALTEFREVRGTRSSILDFASPTAMRIEFNLGQVIYALFIECGNVRSKEDKDNWIQDYSNLCPELYEVVVQRF